jgi:hypothetical protein
MNTTKRFAQINTDDGSTVTNVAEGSTIVNTSSAMTSMLTLNQRVAICFAAGVLGAVAVVIFSHVLFRLGVSGALGIKAPIPLKSPDIYKPLFWGGLWGLLFGLFVKTCWNRLYLVGFLYYLAPMAALFLFFLPRAGAGYFGLKMCNPCVLRDAVDCRDELVLAVAATPRAISSRTPTAATACAGRESQELEITRTFASLRSPFARLG